MSTIKVYENRLSLGYRIPLEKLRITPKLGYSVYDFKALEGHFFGLPETKREISDTGLVVSLALEYEFNRHFGTQLEWSRLDGEFGKLDVTTLGVRFAF